MSERSCHGLPKRQLTPWYAGLVESLPGNIRDADPLERLGAASPEAVVTRSVD